MQERGQGLAKRLSATILAAVVPVVLSSFILLGLTIREVGESARLLLRNHALEATYFVQEWRHDQLKGLAMLRASILQMNGKTTIRQLFDGVLKVELDWDGLGYLPAGDWSRGHWVMRPPLLPPKAQTLLPPDERIWLVSPGLVAMMVSMPPADSKRPDRLVAIIHEQSVARLLQLVGAGRGVHERPFASASYRIEDYLDRLLVASTVQPGHFTTRESGVWHTENGELAMRIPVPETSLKLLWAEPRHLLENPTGRALPSLHMLELATVLGALVWLRRRAGRFLAPLAELEVVARRLGEGDLGARVVQLPPDESGDLGRTFNAMAVQIEHARRDLERAVQDRTRKLNLTNQDLEEAKARLEVLNRDLHTTVDDLKRLDRQRSEFLDALSHDLRIPLTAIQGQVELLEEEYLGPLVDGQRTALSQLREAVVSVTRMLDELLEFTRLERGGGELNRSSFPVREWLRITLLPLKILADRQCQLMTMDVTPDIDEIFADPDRLQSVLSNLVSNAVKFTGHGGRIVIRVRRRDEQLRFEVEDTGRGIAQEEQGKLFQRFYRARGSEDVKGVGLGLAVARGIVEMHGGRIGVVSEPGKGSMFWFEIPQHVKTSE